MKDVEAILFDVGGTLLVGRMPWYELYRRALELAGQPLSWHELAEAYEKAVRHMAAARQAAMSPEGGEVRTLYAYLADVLGLPERRLRQAVDEALYDHPEARHLACADGAVEVLEALRSRGYRLAVLSNWSATLPRTLAQVGLAMLFEAVFASESLGHWKPSAAAFLVPLDRLGLTPGRAAYVGDLYDVDVVGAREVGMRAVLVDPLGLNLHPDARTVTHLAELLALFAGV